MKTCLIRIFKAVLRGIYFFQKLAKTDEKRITFLSRQGNQPSMDFTLLGESILRADPAYRVEYLCRMMGKGLMGKVCYGWHLLVQMHHIARSRVCIIDSYIIPISVLDHKPDLKVFQIWHAVGSVKRIGYQAVGAKSGRSESLAREMDMHRHYTAVLSGSEAMREVFATAFAVEPSQVKVACPPKIEYLTEHLDQVRERIYARYPCLKERKVILYAPTYRRQRPCEVDRLIAGVDLDTYHLIVKGHPVQQVEVAEKRVLSCEEFTAFELIAVADHVITDYSALSIEAAALERPVYFYVYDYDEYVEELGLNIDLYAEMQGCVHTTAEGVMNQISSGGYPYEQLKRFGEKYVAAPVAGSTENLREFIFQL